MNEYSPPARARSIKLPGQQVWPGFAILN